MKLLLLFLFVSVSLWAGDIEKALSAPQAKIPDGQTQIHWRDKLDDAFKEAKSSNRPLFVTFRCLPCKQCASFDKDVLEGGPVLSPLLKQFITVRLTDASQLNTAIFPFEQYQDLDLSWWGYFLSPQGQIYGVFGGKDHVSDQTRISVEAIKNTMKRVLNYHYQPQRKAWNLDGPEPKPETGKFPKDYPMYNDWKNERPWVGKQTCLHCHQVNDIVRYEPVMTGKFNKETDLDMWPLPENAGINLERDHGLKVVSSSNTDKAQHKLQKGDEIVAAGDKLTFSQADFRGVLHRFKDQGKLPVWIKRNGQVYKTLIVLKKDWRQPFKREHLYWRKSVYDGPIGAYQGFWPLKGPKSGKGSMSIKPWFGKDTSKNIAYQAGMRPHHVIIAVDGKSPDLFGRNFVGWFKLNYKKGDKVTFTVLEKGKKKQISYQLKK